MTATNLAGCPPAGEAIFRLTIPARYWDDFSDRSPVDSPEQMASEVRRAGCRVTIEANAEQLRYLKDDADFYAEGNTDDTPAAVLRGAKRVAELCKAISASVQRQ